MARLTTSDATGISIMACINGEGNPVKDQTQPSLFLHKRRGAGLRGLLLEALERHTLQGSDHYASVSLLAIPEVMPLGRVVILLRTVSRRRRSSEAGKSEFQALACMGKFAALG